MIFKKKKEEEKTPREVSSELKLLHEKISRLEEKILNIEKENEKAIQKVAMIRFNPFSGKGGNQSFSLAAMDKKGDGTIITSFYSNEGSSVYGKPVKNGKSEYRLSKEEIEVIDLAMGYNESEKSSKSKKTKR